MKGKCRVLEGQWLKRNTSLQWTVMRLIRSHQTGVKISLSAHFRRQLSLMQTGRVKKSHRNSQILENSEIIKMLILDYMFKNMFIGFWVGLIFLEILWTKKNVVNFVWNPNSRYCDTSFSYLCFYSGPLSSLPESRVVSVLSQWMHNTHLRTFPLFLTVGSLWLTYFPRNRDIIKWFRFRHLFL